MISAQGFAASRDTMDTKLLKGEKHFTTGELVDIGARLTADRLRSMGLLDAVERAEAENLWRLEAAVALLRPLTQLRLDSSLLKLLSEARTQVTSPVRGQAKMDGASSAPGNRSLPSAGTLMIRPRDHFRGNLNFLPNADGGYARKYDKCFRFLVVHPPCEMLWLDEPGGPIYRSPSLAARRAVGHPINGWKWFDISG